MGLTTFNSMAPSQLKTAESQMDRVVKKNNSEDNSIGYKTFAAKKNFFL